MSTRARAFGTRFFVGATLWVAAFLVSLSTIIILNDHFGRLSPARQITRYGEIPFRDYFDPGYFLSEYSSAAVQWLLGDNLLGEALLTAAFIAGGTVLVFVLARRVSGSLLMGLAAAVLALLLFPRAYDYDKVLFYPLGILLCWRYVERPTTARLWGLAAGIVASALYRYDNGVFIAVAALVAMAVVHSGAWATLARQAGGLGIAVGCQSLPFLLILQYTVGITSAVDQMVVYGQRETARTRLSVRPEISIPNIVSVAQVPPPPDAIRSFPLLRVRIFPDAWHRNNADAVLYDVFRLLPLVAGVVLIGDLRRAASSTSRMNMACLTSLITMCLALSVFILRDPVGARFGGMAGPTAVLAAWIAHRAWHVRRSRARRTLRAAVVVGLAVTIWSVSLSAEWPRRLTWESAQPRHLTGMVNALAASPPLYPNLQNSPLKGLVTYLRECTSPRDRVLVTWFAPEVYFYARRGFAAGSVAFFGGHWSETRFQTRSVEILSSQSVPVIITRKNDEEFFRSYPLLVQYLNDHYQDAGSTNFDGPPIESGRYRLFVRRDRQPDHTHPITLMPCF